MLRRRLLLGQTHQRWWGVTFRNPVANALVGTPLNQALEPTQLFESAVELANFFLLMWLLKRKSSTARSSARI